MVIFNKIKHKLNKIVKFKPTNKWKVRTVATHLFKDIIYYYTLKASNRDIYILKVYKSLK
jgi:hypothetical protein